MPTSRSPYMRSDGNAEPAARCVRRRTVRARSCRRILAAAVVGGAALLPPSLLQQAEVISLRPPDATLGAEFTRIVAVRELRDGTVLVTDADEKKLIHADFRARNVEPIGRNGSGPGEYGSASALWELSDDSTLFPDMVNRRWHLLHGGRVVETVPTTAAVMRLTDGLTLGADRAGHVLSERRRGAGAMVNGASVESLVVTRVNRSTSEVDTVATVRWRPYAVPASMAGAVRNPLVSRAFGLPLLGREQALLFPDGWIAIARLDPYRVEWRSPDGRVVQGAALPYTLVKISDAEKRAYIARASKSAGRALPEPTQWPDRIDPFVESALLATPDGQLLIARQPTAAAPGTRYDLVDRRGRLVGRLTLPENEQIAGFGARSAYVVVTDADDLQRLRRHPWP